MNCRNILAITNVQNDERKLVNFWNILLALSDWNFSILFFLHFFLFFFFLFFLFFSFLFLFFYWFYFIFFFLWIFQNFCVSVKNGDFLKNITLFRCCKTCEGTKIIPILIMTLMNLSTKSLTPAVHKSSERLVTEQTRIKTALK